ncbi:MAG TPA: tetratricopeptide repeat protein [Thermoanaerobaculia bacterium]|nr:tetratricopeptide repeat protein [Thermoanaerobaculia bacterium]
MTRPRNEDGARSRLLAAGRDAHRRGDLATAERIYGQARRLAPDDPRVLAGAGALENDLGRPREAVRLLGRAVSLQPERHRWHNNLGNAWRAVGDRAQALESYRRALTLEPGYAKAHANLGVVLAESGDLDGAREQLLAALAADPGLVSARLELARVYRVSGAREAAIAAYREVLARQPDEIGALIDLGALYQLALKPGDARPLLERAVALAPENPLAHFDLAQAASELGDLAQAEASWRRVLELSPGDLASALAVAKLERDRCDWRGWVAMGERLAGLGEAEIAQAPAPFLLNLYPVPAAVHQRVAAAYAGRFVAEAAPHAAAVAALRRPRRPAEPLRLGYLSADFRHHPVGHLVHRLFERHNRRRFTVYAYSLIPAEDEVTLAVRRGVDVYRPCASLTDEAVARRIAEDGIDLLVDLTGYTTYSRTAILALRPAPLQLQLLGYVNTLAAPFIDATVVDDRLIGPEQRRWLTEKVIRLPGCFLPVSPLDALGPPASPLRRADCGLPEGAPVLCSFNAPHKLDPPTFDAWMEILHRVPAAVLWLFDGGEAAAPLNLCREAEVRGVTAGRLVFAGKRPYPQHLTRYPLADLFLDSFGYNGGATTVDALRQGLAVLTLPGESPLSRMGASLVAAAGLPELVMASREAYVEAAVRIAGEPAQAARLAEKARAARGSSLLFDLPSWVRRFEAGLEAAWEGHSRGRLEDVIIEPEPASG